MGTTFTFYFTFFFSVIPEQIGLVPNQLAFLEQVRGFRCSRTCGASVFSADVEEISNILETVMG
jgi:hypothetical protein